MYKQKGALTVVRRLVTIVCCYSTKDWAPAGYTDAYTPMKGCELCTGQVFEDSGQCNSDTKTFLYSLPE